MFPSFPPTNFCSDGILSQTSGLTVSVSRRRALFLHRDDHRGHVTAGAVACEPLGFVLGRLAKCIVGSKPPDPRNFSVLSRRNSALANHSWYCSGSAAATMRRDGPTAGRGPSPTSGPSSLLN